MPYAAHPRIQTPPDDQRVWRYVDLTKLMALLEYRELYFANVDELAIEDPFEGTLTRSTINELRRGRSLGDGFYNVRLIQEGRSLVYASCWHLSARESHAMWKLYVPNKQGIAIQSTIGRIKQAVQAIPHAVFMGAVQYVDYESAESEPETSPQCVALWKRLGFEYERELRVMVAPESDANAAVPGLSCGVDLGALIEAVYVAPTSPDWIAHLLERVFLRYELEIRVEQSSLDDPPLTI